MRVRAKAARPPKLPPRSQLLLVILIASLSFGIGTFVVVGNIVIVKTHPGRSTTFVEPRALPSRSEGQAEGNFNPTLAARYAIPSPPGNTSIRWGYSRPSPFQGTTYYLVKAPRQCQSSECVTIFQWPSTSVDALDATTRTLLGLASAFLVGFFVIFIRWVRGVLDTCYAASPHPRPARSLALVSGLLPEQEQRQWWLEVCATLAESAPCDRRSSSWSYLRSAPALIITSWRLHDSYAARRTIR